MPHGPVEQESSANVCTCCVAVAGIALSALAMTFLTILIALRVAEAAP